MPHPPLPLHPTTISDLDTDCRRVLLDHYMLIQVASQTVRIGTRRQNFESVEEYECLLSDAQEERQDAIKRATATYRDVAAQWDVEVG